MADSSIKFHVTFFPEGKKVRVAKDTTILRAAERADVYVNSICGGEGTCGKCRVIVKSGKFRTYPSALISDKEIAEGCVLACLTKVQSDLVVEIPPEIYTSRSNKGKEETSGRFNSLSDWDFTKTGFALDPPVQKYRLQLPPPTLGDNRDDFSRLLHVIRRKTKLSRLTAPISILRQLPETLRNSNWDLTVTIADREGASEITSLHTGQASKGNYGVAVDIGTTTVVAHLVDLETGITLDADAVYNSQIIYGEDVIKRIIRSEEEGIEPLSHAVRQDINNLIKKLRAQNKLKSDDITTVICAGNSTMISLFLGITPRNIRREPYIPPVSDPPPIPASQAGLTINKTGILYCVPGIASWVGGDITAGMLSAGINRSPEISLLIDIGTNGEIVIGNRDWQLACSCSAGPAFEGSGILCGSRAIAGAIDKVDITDEDQVIYQTIGGDPPIGICGSGLLDAVSELFRAGKLGRDGRFDPNQSPKHLIEFHEQPAFIIAAASETAVGRDIIITQGDINNLIRAKAAIHAGIAVLLKAVNLSPDALARVFISGGFGNYINIKRAVCIGLIPHVNQEKIFFIGNGSVRGAKTMLLSKEAIKKARELAASTTYFELSTDPGFMDEYTRAMFLPHTDIENFTDCDK